MKPFAVNPDIGLWERNAVLNGLNSFYVTDDVEGTLSIKSVLNGEGSWITPSDRYPLDPGSYLVLNKGQRYSVDIRSREAVETFCVFFQPGFVESVSEARGAKYSDLLEESEAGCSVEFYERLNPAGDSISLEMTRIRALLSRGEWSQMEVQEAMLRIAHALLDANTTSRRERDRLDLAKGSTRGEVIRRLNVARDYMITHLSDAANLEEIAGSACLSPFHFHRLFKSAFGMTPHEFIAHRRLEKAKRLLSGTPQVMTEIAWAVGFETQAAFSKFFARSTGLSPTAFRNQSRN